jgi:hypothetical protein
VQAQVEFSLIRVKKEHQGSDMSTEAKELVSSRPSAVFQGDLRSEPWTDLKGVLFLLNQVGPALPRLLSGR